MDLSQRYSPIDVRIHVLESLNKQSLDQVGSPYVSPKKDAPSDPSWEQIFNQNSVNQNRKIICTNANNIFEIFKVGCVHSFEGQCQKIIMVGL